MWHLRCRQGFILRVRLRALATRAQHYTLGYRSAAWFLPYADDEKIAARADDLIISILLALFLLVSFGFPVK